MAGDLNIIMDAKDKKGCVCGRDPMLKLVENLIISWELIDFKPKKGRYTWTSNRTKATNISARLDQFLVQISLLLDKKIISSCIFPKITSDHKLIMLQIKDEEDLGLIPFRFNPLGKERDGFMSTVTMAWDLPVVGSPKFVWERKLKNTKAALKD